METPLPVQIMPEVSPSDLPDFSFAVIKEVLKERRGFDLGSYKDKCMKRRIAIRMRATRCQTADDYCTLIRCDQLELDRLLKVLTIHVTQFFRNPSAFGKLQSETFPYLFARAVQQGRDRLRLWSVGCASGEEPYTLALILRESFAEELGRVSAALLASDVNAEILKVARTAIFGPERLKEAPSAIRGKYFTLLDGRYHLLPEIKAMVEFQQRDLNHTENYPPSDLILCRNVLIYFERKQQEKIMHCFADALDRGGILVLGKSETLVGESRSRFETLCPIERIYRKC